MADCTGEEFSEQVNDHTTTYAIKTKISELEGKDWPAQLAKASRELTRVCLYSHTLLPPLLFHAKYRAQNSNTLILKYKKILQNLHLLGVPELL